jgi:hypothetical protein
MRSTRASGARLRTALGHALPHVRRLQRAMRVLVQLRHDSGEVLAVTGRRQGLKRNEVRPDEIDWEA